MRRLFIAFSLIFGGLFVAMPTPVSAQCSCGETAANVNSSAAAALATVLGRSQDLWVAEVTTDIKGNLPEQISIRTRDNHQCEVQWLAGRDIAVVLQLGEDGVLTADGCSEVSEVALLEWERPRGSPGDVAAVATGAWQGYRVIAVAPDGAVRAYGYEPGRVEALSICPGGKRMVEAVASGDTSELAVRSLTTFEIERTTAIDTNEPPTEVHCVDDDADEILFRSEDSLYLATGDTIGPHDGDWPNQVAVDGSIELDPSIPTATHWAFPNDEVALTSVPVGPEPQELALNEPPTIGGWSGWLVVLVAVGGAAYLLKKSTNAEWRSSWAKPDNGRNSTGRRREETRGPGRFNG